MWVIQSHWLGAWENVPCDAFDGFDGAFFFGGRVFPRWLNCRYVAKWWCWVVFERVFKKWEMSTRWFKVTFSSPIWRSLNHLKGHLTIPKRSLWITWKGIFSHPHVFSYTRWIWRKLDPLIEMCGKKSDLFGMVSSGNLLRGCWWPPTKGQNGTLNHLVLRVPLISCERCDHFI